VIDFAPGVLLPLSIDKPAAGGRMIARHEGRVILVGGAIPGEHVIARVQKVGKGVVYADVSEVHQPSSDRRDPGPDPSCGGCLYAHIAYGRQIALKGQVIADAFQRIGRLQLPGDVAVIASARDEGYRMRARLHVRGRRLGFFREGSHDLCDPRHTRQLLPETCVVLEAVGTQLRGSGDTVREIDVTENLDGSQRVVHLAAVGPLDRRDLASVTEIAGLTGVTMSTWPAGESAVVSGVPHVVDELVAASATVRLRRHVLSFFQGNRYLLQTLADHVSGHVPAGARVIDLYAGAGLFAVSVAAGRDARVVAVEGDRSSAADLQANVAALGGAVEAVQQSVEAFTARTHESPDVLIVDPPRTGMSLEALEGAIKLAGRAIVYVSCDVATLARDARRLVDRGYQLREVRGIDLFPNTPHVEAVAVFERVR
jgi:23S rRNA (uracil1939-C5)-methyltransferase